MALPSSVLLCLAEILTAAAPAGHSASPISVSAKLDNTSEVPNPGRVPISAGGSFSTKLKGTTLNWKLIFSRLSRATVAADIHSGAKRKAGR